MKTRTEDYKARRRAKELAEYAADKAAGKCVRCGDKASVGYTRCDTCRLKEKYMTEYRPQTDARRAKARARYAARKAGRP